jgi:hypothetical protein
MRRITQPASAGRRSAWVSGSRAILRPPMSRPLDPNEQMLGQLRELVGTADVRANPRRWRRYRRRMLLRQRLPSGGTLAMVAVAVASLVAAAALLLIHWPIGGGAQTSELAISQGAGLVFVVLLLSLLPGAVEAGRTIGWDVTWIVRDRLIWIGLTLVASLSIAELAIGWARPDHAEEAATILMSIAGLAIVGLLARRLLLMSDPAEQLRARVRSQLPRIIRLLVTQRQEEYRRALEQGFEEDLARQLESTPSPGVVRGMTGVLKPIAALGLRLAEDRRHDQAMTVQGSFVEALTKYVAVAGQLGPTDEVVKLFTTKAIDLHALADGPRGRDLSTLLLNQLKFVGEAIRRNHATLSVAGGEGFVLLPLAQAADTMARRRLDDSASTDPAHGISVIGQLALASVDMDDGVAATAIGELALAYAPAATATRNAAIAWPAWRASIDLLMGLARAVPPTGDPSTIDRWSKDLSEAIASLPAIPHPLFFSGGEPVVGTPMGTGASLAKAIHELWQIETLPVDLKMSVTRRMANALEAPLDRCDLDDRHFQAEDVAQFWHQLACAAGNGALSYREQELEAIDSIAERLGALRGLWTAENADQGILHPYVTDLILAIYLARDYNELPPALTAELTALHLAIATVSETRAAERGILREATTWTADAMRAAGHPALAEEVSSWSSPRTSRYEGHGALAGLGGGRRLNRGFLIPQVVTVVEEWWLDTRNDRPRTDQK